jgi:hypothetical protein
MSKQTLEKKLGRLRVEFCDQKKVLLRLLDAQGVIVMVAVRRPGENNAELEKRLWSDADKRYAEEAKR